VRGIENVEHAKIRNGLCLFVGLLIDFDFKQNALESIGRKCISYRQDLLSNRPSGVTYSQKLDKV